MSATCNPKPNLLNQFTFMIFALPLGAIALLFISITVLASLVMILTPIGMMLAPTWSVQLFYWKFESALDAWYLPVFGILLDFCLFHMTKWMMKYTSRNVRGIIQ